MDTIIQNALEEYKYYFDGYENDSAEDVLNGIEIALNTKDYSHCKYLDNALHGYYQLGKHSYATATNQIDKHDFKHELTIMDNYFKHQKHDNK